MRCYASKHDWLSTLPLHLCAAALALTACAAGVTVTARESPLSVSTSEVPTAAPPEPNPEPTRIAAPATATAQPTSSPTLEATDIPVSGTTIADVLRSSPGCSLPCWEGLAPGSSSIDELRGLLLRIARNPSRISDEMVMAEVEIVLPGTPTDLEGTAWWNTRNGAIVALEVSLRGFTNLGAVEFRELDRLLGLPTAIRSAMEQEGLQLVVLDYSELGVLIRFAYMDLEYGDICLPKEPTTKPTIVLYVPSDHAQVLEVNGLSAGDWAKRLGLSTEELWRQLQDPSRCIPYG